jgi:hypothetical protein
MEDLNTREGLLNTMRGLRDALDRDVAEAGEARMEQPGSFGDLTFKDIIVHLTGWREVTAARLEAAQRGEEPVFPWPAQLTEEEDTDEINRWFYEAGRDKPVADVLRESRETFDRVERAIAALPEDDLFERDRFPWLQGYALGPGVVEGTREHYRVDHEPEIRAWLARG